MYLRQGDSGELVLVLHGDEISWAPDAPVFFQGEAVGVLEGPVTGDHGDCRLGTLGAEDRPVFLYDASPSPTQGRHEAEPDPAKSLPLIPTPVNEISPEPIV